MRPDIRHLKKLGFFPESMWTERSFAKRSEELSPIFIHRYRGGRKIIGNWSHAFWELGSVLGGKGELCWGPKKKILELRKNVTYLMPPEVKHSETTSTTLDTIWIGFFGTRLDVKSVRQHFPVAISNVSLSQYVEHLWIFSRQHKGPIGPELDSMTANALNWYLRLVDEGQGSDIPFVRNIIKFLEEHFEERMSINSLARRFGCSEGYFFRIFKRHTGISPLSFLVDIRMRQATQLLHHTNLQVGEISARVGYENPFYFSRLFHKRMGVTPTECREGFRSGI